MGDNLSGWAELLWACRVSCLQSRSTRPARKNRELLTEGEILQHQVTPDAHGIAQREAEEQEIGDQGTASFRDGYP